MLYPISWKKLKKVEKVKKKFCFGRFWPFFGSKKGYQMRFWAWTKWLFYRRIIWGVDCYCMLTFRCLTGLRKESFRHQNQAFFGVKFGHFWKPFFFQPVCHIIHSGSTFMRFCAHLAPPVWQFWAIFWLRDSPSLVSRYISAGAARKKGTDIINFIRCHCVVQCTLVQMYKI